MYVRNRNLERQSREGSGVHFKAIAQNHKYVDRDRREGFGKTGYACADSLRYASRGVGLGRRFYYRHNGKGVVRDHA